MSAPPRASVGAVVLRYGAPRDGVEALVGELAAQGVEPRAIVVVDNGPHAGDGPAGARYVAARGNAGYAGGMNLGIRELTAEAPALELVLLVTEDVQLAPGAVPALVAAACRAPAFGLLGPEIRWRSRGAPFSLGGTRDRHGQLDHERGGSGAGRGPGGVRPCDWVDGCCVLVRRAVLDAVGGLDDRFFLYFEDADLALRAVRAGWRVGVVTGAVVEQEPGGAGRPGAYAYLVARNGLEHARRAAGGSGVAHALAAQRRELARLGRHLAGRRSTRAERSEALQRIVGTVAGTGAFVRRRWGPPPRWLPGQGDIAGTARTLALVSTFSPARDGIAKYADQLAGSLARRGKVVRVGLPGSDADRSVAPRGGLRPLRLVRATRADEDVLVMWHPEFFVAGGARGRLASYLALGAAYRLRRTAAVVHEPDGVPHERAVRWARSWCWRGPREVVFHSWAEGSEFARSLGRAAPKARLGVVQHGAAFARAAVATPEDARVRLGLAAGRPIFVCPGFLGHHKGFDRALTAFARARTNDGRLYVVGSQLYASPEVEEHARALRRQAARTPGAELVERYVGDEEFDLWLLAADAVVLPYRSTASSSVAARARLLERRIVATRVGALPEQLGPHDIVVDDDDGLVRALERLAAAPGP